MPEIGRIISHYRIIEKLGEGGMGVVYRAEDTNLNREVAIKVLPDIFSGDPERLARFEREAKLLASLNHPNIAAIHGLEEAGGKRFLVLELVEGETLAQRIAKGPLPIDEALEVCRQIAEGLEAAHEKGIIHRDLKPANIKITPEGKVKILDFGLAKAFQGEAPVADASKSPTLTDQMTRPGVILGTAAYMAPEQAKGKAVDKRADIWAFGCILFECIAGKRPFEGETVTETMAAILMRDPAWDSLPAMVPEPIKGLIRRCLAKDVKRRLRDIGDAAMEMETSSQGPASSASTVSRISSAPWLSTGIALALLAGVTIGGWFVSRLRPGGPEGVAKLSRLYIPLGVEECVQVYYDTPSLTISEDGRRIAWVGGKLSDTKIFIRELDSLEIKSIPGTEGVFAPALCFSADGQWIYFARLSVLYKIPISGGAPTPVYSAQDSVSLPIGPRWTERGVVFNLSDLGIQRVSHDGGTPDVLTRLDPGQHESSHCRERLIPGGSGLFFNVVFDNSPVAHIDALNLTTKERTKVLENAFEAQYVATGHVIFVRGRSLFAAPFDLRQMRVTGGITALPYSMQTDSSKIVSYWDISRDGTLVYVPYDPAASETRLTWVDRSNHREPITLPPGRYSAPRCAPDGHSLAYDYSPAGGAGEDAHIFDIARGIPHRLSQSERIYWVPVWSPNSAKIAFQMDRDGMLNIWFQTVNNPSELGHLSASQNSRIPQSWSGSGRYFLYTERPRSIQLDLYIADLEHPEAKPIPLATSAATESFGRFCPTDDRWVAFTRQEGSGYEVYIKEFIPESPATGMEKRVSAAGGAEPVWSPRGDEIFYRSIDGKKLYSVSFKAKPTIDLGAEKMVLDKLSMPPFDIVGSYSYDIDSDGKRFIMVLGDESYGTARNLVVVQNWFEELKRLVPTGKK
jgi:serine/threonine protein kinase/Tol biopolymer transport system component